MDITKDFREASGQKSGGSGGIWLFLWWGIVGATAYAYGFTPAWAFAALCGASAIVTLLALVWRRSWFLTLRARCCCGPFCCAPPAPRLEEATLKQHSPWRKQLSLVFEMAAPYFRSSRRGRWLFGGMIFLTLLDSALNVVFSYTSKAFYNALEQKDAEVFRKVLIVYTSILVGGAPVAALYNFQRQRLAIAWRQWMTERTMHLYLKQQVYYLLDKDIDNPDQRIAQDVNAFTAFSLSLLVTILNNTINLISMSVILYTIEPQLFLVIIAYTFAGTAVSVCLGRRLVPLNFERLQYEADLRYSLVRLREHAESIAFYRGESVERSNLSRRIDQVVSNQKEVIGTERNLQMFTALYQYMTLVLPVAVVAPQYFAGAIELGVVTQARSAFLQVTADLSIIIDQFSELSAFSAGIDRLSSFYEAVREADSSRSNQLALLQESPGDPKGDDYSPPPVARTIALNQSSRFACSDVTLMTPDGSRTLIHNLSIGPSSQQSHRLLITGPSGVGKSSLLRAIGGLWTRGDGIVERPPDAFFLPQQPYCTLGSLRDQLMYPRTDDDAVVSDQELASILERVGLSHLQGELLADADWAHRLSLGEQQRLAFGRILLHAPSFCLLDEATSALDLEAEHRMYQLLQRTVQSYVSVGHRPTLYHHHEQRLNLLTTGGYEITEIAPPTTQHHAAAREN